MAKKTGGRGYLAIPIEQVGFDQGYLRKTQADLSQLKNTISDVGLLQPIIVRKSSEGYSVIDGQRRLQALKELGVPELIVGRDVIIDADETEADARFKRIIANVQREDINDIELGHAFVELKEQYGYQYNEISEIIGKTPHYVSAKVGLAKRLTTELQDIIISDWNSAKCIRNNFSPEESADLIYEMNVNIIEEIARLDAELQRPAYDTIRAREMDKKGALEYLRSIKRDAEVMKLASDVKGLMETYASDEPGRMEPLSDRQLRGCFKKINRDLDKLVEATKTSGPGEREQVIPVLETLIERLTSLCTEIKAGEKVAGRAEAE
ncbi:ParB/RepB/Spo0J family partition protein [Methanocella sp. MCL-LM]|uniref:ParB/RepB/Spo0J family partition protein n=1 Tax=Methanocella sp. MCL-LM TaxID=3412035 RepID=UPI003C75C0EC